MFLMERALVRAGHTTLNLGYPSTRRSIADLADEIAPSVTQFARSAGGPLHIVTHSMGGLLARVLLARHPVGQVGRIVMLAPPNGGSEIADLLHRNPLYRRWFGPAGGQLVTRRDAALRGLLASPVGEVGVIAGNRSIYPLSWALLPKPNDGRVSVAATHLAGMIDHITLPVSHPMILRSPRAIDQTLAFLAQGRFDSV